MAELYLISPEKFNLKQFAQDLAEVLATDSVAAFQLRMKDCAIDIVAEATKVLLPLCHQHNVPFIINDHVALLRDHAIDGIHLGEEDSKVKAVRNEFGKDLIIGASCYNSKHLAMVAGEEGASYIAFGSLFPSPTKITKHVADVEILKWATQYINLPCCAIGGINQKNIMTLKDTNVDFVCAISAVWQHPQGPVEAAKILAEMAAEL